MQNQPDWCNKGLAPVTAVITPTGRHEEGKDRSFITVDNRERTAVRIRFIITQSKREPSGMLFGALRNPRLKMLKPIPLTISRDESGSVAVCWEAIQEFGYGANLHTALQDFSATIAELHFFLESEAQRLGEDLGRVSAILREHIAPRR